MVSPRKSARLLASAAGQLAALFAAHPETQSAQPASQWPEEDLLLAGRLLADVALAAVGGAGTLGLDVGQCVGDKFAKNDAKYPAARVRGSSAKYTFYQQQHRGHRGAAAGGLTALEVAAVATTVALVAAAVGFAFGRRQLRA